MKLLAHIRKDEEKMDASLCVEAERHGLFQHETFTKPSLVRKSCIEVWAKDGVEVGHRHKSKQLMDIS